MSTTTNFRKLMNANGYTDDTVSFRVKQRIKQHDKDLADIATLRSSLKDKNLSEKERKKIETAIVSLEDNVKSLDDKISRDVERLAKNGYGKGGAYDKMKDKIKGPVAATPAEPAPPPEPAAPAEPAKPVEPAAAEPKKETSPPPKPNRQQPPAPAPAKEKKGDNTIWWVLSIAGAAIAAAFGFKAWKNRGK